MAAQIIQLDTRRPARSTPFTAPTIMPACVPAISHDLSKWSDKSAKTLPFQFWQGSSGARYVHTIYPLLSCPQVPAGNYILVKHKADGTRTALAVGRMKHGARSLNLAQIRHLGARLGANEVHVHLLADTGGKAMFVEYDIRAHCFSAPQISLARH